MRIIYSVKKPRQSLLLSSPDTQLKRLQSDSRSSSITNVPVAPCMQSTKLELKDTWHSDLSSFKNAGTSNVHKQDLNAPSNPGTHSVIVIDTYS